MMKRKILLCSVAIAILGAGAANANCVSEIEKASETHAKMLAEEKATHTAKARAMRDLRDTALRLSDAGNEAGCMTVMDAIQELASVDPVTAKGSGDQAKSADQTENAAAQQSDTTTQAATDTEEAIRERIVEFKNAEGVWNSGDLKGINVYNYRNEFLGEVDGLLIKEGSAPTHLIVGHGGFWNIGDEEAAIPLNAVMWDPEWEVFYVEMTEEEIDNAPDFDKTDSGWTADKNDGYYSNLRN